MQESKEISIIIVNYKSRNHIKACVDSIFSKLETTNFEILIINNDPEEKIESDFFNFPEVRIVNNSLNNGFAAGSNSGARLAKGKWLFFLNPDTTLLTNQAKILKLIKKDGNLGIVSPQLINENGEIQRWSFGKTPSLTELFRNNVIGKNNTENKKSDKIDWVSGAAMFVKKDIFTDIGEFDEAFFMYFEDIDFCKRAKEKGIGIRYFPEEKVKHLGGKSIKDKRKQKKDYYESQDYYFKKHHGIIKTSVVRALRKIFGKNNV